MLKIPSLFYRSRKYPTPSEVLYFCKCQIKQTIEHCCHIGDEKYWILTFRFRLISKRLRGLLEEIIALTLHPLYPADNIWRVSLLYRYFHVKFSDKFHSLVLLVSNFQCFDTLIYFHRVESPSYHHHVSQMQEESILKCVEKIYSYLLNSFSRAVNVCKNVLCVYVT